MIPIVDGSSVRQVGMVPADRNRRPGMAMRRSTDTMNCGTSRRKSHRNGGTVVRLIFLSMLLTIPATAQETESDSLHATLSTPRLLLVGGITVGAFLYGHAILNNLWWKKAPSAFHFDWDHDWRYSLGADKFGHAYFPFLADRIYTQAFEWSGMDSTSSVWTAAAVAMTYQTYIEIRDGYSAEWGFSVGDFTADVIGSAYPIVQHYAPVMKHFTPKISFYPSAKFRAGAYGSIIDDYESAYHWISIDVVDFLPESIRPYYPAFVNLAIGHSVKNLDGMGGGQHEFYLSLDWNLERLPGDGWFLRLLKHNLNLYHLPAPAIRLTPGVVWYGLHF